MFGEQHSDVQQVGISKSVVQTVDVRQLGVQPVDVLQLDVQQLGVRQLGVQLRNNQQLLKQEIREEFRDHTDEKLVVLRNKSSIKTGTEKREVDHAIQSRINELTCLLPRDHIINVLKRKISELLKKISALNPNPNANRDLATINNELNKAKHKLAKLINAINRMKLDPELVLSIEQLNKLMAKSMEEADYSMQKQITGCGENQLEMLKYAEKLTEKKIEEIKSKQFSVTRASMIYSKTKTPSK